MEAYFDATGVKWNVDYVYFPPCPSSYFTPEEELLHQKGPPANAAVFLDVKF
jgi:hypothetical protein